MTTTDLKNWLGVATASAVLCGCTPGPKAVGGATFDTIASAPTPHLAFLWNQQMSSWRYLDVEPKEFATPSHVGATDEVVVATQQGEVAKLQAANGAVLWRTRLHEASVHAGPVVGDTQAYVADLEGNLRALNLQTGEVEWQQRMSTSVETRGAYDRGRLFYSDANDVLWAFDASTGEPIWSHSRDVPEFFTIKGSCQPVVDVDVVYCGFSDGKLLALDIDAGTKVWEADLSGGLDAFVDVDGAVELRGRRLFALSYAGGLFALDRASGEIVWRQDVESAADVAYGTDTAYVASAVGYVTAYDLQEGEPKWRFRLKGALPGGVVAFGNYVLIFTTDGPVYVLDGQTGHVFTKWRGTTGFFAPPEKGSSRVYALTNHGLLMGLGLAY